MHGSKHLCLKRVKTECVVSSWFSSSLIDQQHGAESKRELNGLHQGFVALSGDRSSLITDNPLFYSSQLIDSVLCFLSFFHYLPIFLSPARSCPLCCCSSSVRLDADKSSVFSPVAGCRSGLSWNQQSQYVILGVWVCEHL